MPPSHGNTRTRVLTLRQHAPVLRVQGDRLRRLRWVHARWSRPSSRPDARERFARVLSPLGLAATEAPRVEVGEEAERWAAQWFDQNHMAGAVVLAPVARHATKRWPQEYWIELLDRLGVAGIPVIVASLGRERRELPALDAAVAVTPRTHWLTEPLPRMAAVLGNGRAAVTCDSGWMHLAAARGMRVVALFGSTAPELGFAPAGEGHVVLCRHEPCQPCTLHGRDQCPLGHFRCMRELKPDEVWRALESLLTTPA